MLAVKLSADKEALHELSIFTKRCIQSRTTPFPVRSKHKFSAVPGLGHDCNQRPEVPVKRSWDCKAVGPMRRARFASFPPRPCTALSSQGWQQLPSASLPHLMDLEWTTARAADAAQLSSYSAAHHAKAVHNRPITRFLFGNRRSLTPTCFWVCLM